MKRGFDRDNERSGVGLRRTTASSWARSFAGWQVRSPLLRITGCIPVRETISEYLYGHLGETNLKNHAINNGPSHTNTAAQIDCEDQLDIDEENNCGLFQLGVDIKRNQDLALLSTPCNSMESATEWTFYVEYR